MTKIGSKNPMLLKKYVRGNTYYHCNQIIWLTFQLSHYTVFFKEVFWLVNYRSNQRKDDKYDVVKNLTFNHISRLTKGNNKVSSSTKHFFGCRIHDATKKGLA